MKPGVAERKWEIDSLCYPMRLSHEYWRRTRDKAPFDDTWSRAMKLAVETFRVQQRKHGPGPYHFQRKAQNPTDSLKLGGYGRPTRTEEPREGKECVSQCKDRWSRKT